VNDRLGNGAGAAAARRATAVSNAELSNHESGRLHHRLRRLGAPLLARHVYAGMPRAQHTATTSVVHLELEGRQQLAAAVVVATASITAAAEPSQQQRQFKVREAREDEYVRIAQVVNQAFSGEKYRNGNTGPRTSPDGRLREALLKGGSESRLLVAVDQSDGVTICGTLLLNQWYAAEDFPSAAQADTGVFGQLAVSSHARRTGVGRLLVAAAEVMARAHGKTRMELCYVNWDEDSLAPFYSSMGYVKGQRKYVGEAAEWLAPEWRVGFYFQQMVKML
jgi:GNAT superfamily N-acetyltransferase